MRPVAVLPCFLGLFVGCASSPDWASGPLTEVSSLGHCYRGHADGQASDEEARVWAERQAMGLVISETASAAASSVSYRRENNGTVSVWAGNEGDHTTFVLRQEGVHVDEAETISRYSDVSFPVFDADVRVCADAKTIDAMRAAFLGGELPVMSGQAETLIAKGEEALGRGDLVAAKTPLGRALSALGTDGAPELRARAESALARITDGLVIGFVEAPANLEPGQDLSLKVSVAASFEGKPLENVRFICRVDGASCDVEGATDASGIANVHLSKLDTVGQGTVELELRLSDDLGKKLTLGVEPPPNTVLLCADDASSGLADALAKRLVKNGKTLLDASSCSAEEPAFYADVFIRLRQKAPSCAEKKRRTTCKLQVTAEVRAKSRGFGRGARVRKSAKKKSEAAAIKSATKKLKKSLLKKVAALVEAAS